MKKLNYLLATALITGIAVMMKELILFEAVSISNTFFGITAYNVFTVFLTVTIFMAVSLIMESIYISRHGEELFPRSARPLSLIGIAAVFTVLSVNGWRWSTTVDTLLIGASFTALLFTVEKIREPVDRLAGLHKKSGEGDTK